MNIMLYDVLICDFLRIHQKICTLDDLIQYIKNEYGSEYDEKRFQFEIEKLINERVIRKNKNNVILLKE